MSRRRPVVWSAIAGLVVVLVAVLILVVTGRRVTEPYANVNLVSLSGAVVGDISTSGHPCDAPVLGLGTPSVAWSVAALLPGTATTPGGFLLRIAGDRAELTDLASGRHWVGHNVVQVQHTPGIGNGDTVGLLQGQLTPDQGGPGVQVSGSWSCTNP